MRHNRDFKIDRMFALPFLPAFIRTGPGWGVTGHSLFASGYWKRWGKYTRVRVWKAELNRYRTIKTFEGWLKDEEILGQIPEELQ